MLYTAFVIGSGVVDMRHIVLVYISQYSLYSYTWQLVYTCNILYVCYLMRLSESSLDFGFAFHLRKMIPATFNRLSGIWNHKINPAFKIQFFKNAESAEILLNFNIQHL